MNSLLHACDRHPSTTFASQGAMEFASHPLLRTESPAAGRISPEKGVAAMEANAREYVPAANKPWEDRFPGIFKVRDGMMDTSTLDRPGLGVV